VQVNDHIFSLVYKPKYIIYRLTTSHGSSALLAMYNIISRVRNVTQGQLMSGTWQRIPGETKNAPNQLEVLRPNSPAIKGKTGQIE